jgi:hypothetical protein
MDPKMERLYRLHPELAIAKLDELQTLVRDFFTFLDHTEESDSGKIFHPITISCVRVLMIEPLSACLNKMKDTVGVKEVFVPTGTSLIPKKTMSNSIDKDCIDPKTAQRIVRICNKCGHAHAAISRAEANLFFEQFKVQFEEMGHVARFEQFGTSNIENVSLMKNMETCFNCGNSHYDFHNQRPDEKLLDGITLQSIIKD